MNKSLRCPLCIDQTWAQPDRHTARLARALAFAAGGRGRAAQQAPPAAAPAPGGDQWRGSRGRHGADPTTHRNGRQRDSWGSDVTS